MDPVARRVSHIVVRKGIFFPEDKVIPLSDVATATAERVNLVEGVAPDNYPPFQEHHFIPLASAVDFTRQNQPPPATPVVPPYAWYGLHGALPPAYETFFDSVFKRNVPEEAVTLEPGSAVVAADDAPVGDVSQVLATEDGFATHVVIRDDGLGAYERAIPVTFIDRIIQNRVHLGVDAAVVSALRPFDREGDQQLSVDPNASPVVRTNGEVATEIGGYRLQALLVDLVDLTLQLQHVRWNLPIDAQDLRVKLDDFDALTRASADTVAQRMREMGVAADGRINTLYHDMLFDRLSSGPFDPQSAVGILSTHLAQLAGRLRESAEVLQEPDPASYKVVTAVSDELLAWSERFDQGQ
jgi:DNA-binding ferritin-like protein